MEIVRSSAIYSFIQLVPFPLLTHSPTYPLTLSRKHCEAKLQLTREHVGQLSTEMIPHFFESFATNARLTLHVHVIHGFNDHHKAESAFKAFAQALRQAVARDGSAGVPSTKGVLS